MSKRQTNQTAHDDADFQDFQNLKRPSSGFLSTLKYLPVGLLTSVIGIVLYVTVRGLCITTQIPYVVVGYLVGALGLTFAYNNVAKSIQKQRSKQFKNNYSSIEGIWFSLFYNNAFYIFLLFFFSQIAFSSIAAQTSLVLAQLLSSVIPAWLSSLSN